MSSPATRWAWNAGPRRNLDMPHRLTLLAAADLLDRTVTESPAADLSDLLPGVLDDVTSATEPPRATTFEPAQIAEAIGVTSPTVLRYCRNLTAWGLLETTDNRSFSLPAAATA